MSLIKSLQELEQEHGMAKIVDQLAEMAKDHEGNLATENPLRASEWHTVCC